MAIATVDPRLQGVVDTFKKSTFGRWQEQEGVRGISDFAIVDVREVELAPWPRLGVNATFLNLYAMMEGAKGMFVAEIPAGGQTEQQRHLYEQVILILDGEGTTEIWQQGDAQHHVFEWHRGSAFSPPLNTCYRMFNLGKEPVRFLAVNEAPMIMNGFRNSDFVFESPYAFRDRFSGEEGFFKQTPPNLETSNWLTNFIPDFMTSELAPGEFKGSGNFRMQYRMAGNSLGGHMAEWPTGRYHKAHYHPAGPVLMGLRSAGYVLIWPKSLGTRPYETGHGDEVVDFKWKQGSLYAPPTGWFHQHFNTGNEPARHISVRNAGGGGTGFGPVRPPERLTVTLDVNLGGALIEYEDEDPEIRRRYEAALRASGVENQMPSELYEKGSAIRRPDLIPQE
ncbi:MAG TPA: cupin domain-containing protein [Chloroflexota bacterium]